MLNVGIFNILGALLFIVAAVGLWREGPPIVKIEAFLRQMPFFLKSVFAGTALLLVLFETKLIALPGRFGFILWILHHLLWQLSYWTHEAGHAFFRPFPQSIHIAGGTVFQVLVPLALVARFARRRCPQLAALAVFWLGAGLFSTAAYIADARALELPLLGYGTHDWHFMLGQLGLLEYDAALSRIVLLLAWLASCGAIAGFLLPKRTPT